VREQRPAIARLLTENPCLEPKLPVALADGSQGGGDLALSETDLLVRPLPAPSPSSLEAALEAGTGCDTSGDWGDLGL
jgi:hypothetical protein